MIYPWKSPIVQGCSEFIYLFIYVYVYVCAWWGGKKLTSIVHLIFWEKVSYWTKVCVFCLDWLAREPPRSAHLCLPSSGITDVCTVPSFDTVDEDQSSDSPNPDVGFLITSIYNVTLKSKFSTREPSPSPSVVLLIT